MRREREYRYRGRDSREDREGKSVPPFRAWQQQFNYIEHSTFNIYLLTLCIRVVLSASMGSSNTSALSRPNIIAEINQILRIIQGDAKLVPIDQSQATGLDLQKKMIQWSHLSSRSSIRERFDFVLVRRQTLGIYLLEIYKNNRHRKSKVKGLNKCLSIYLLILFLNLIYRFITLAIFPPQSVQR